MSRNVLERGTDRGGGLLRVPAAVYGLAIRLRMAVYHWGILRSRRLAGFVLSVGNVTAGGTGKTPAVELLARWAREQGYRPAVLSRGYGGNYREPVHVVSDGRDTFGDARECGDEPVLLARRLDGVPVVLARRRHRAGSYALEQFGRDFLILDDGFQHLALVRDFNLLLLDAETPFGNGRLLPAGSLREPLSALRRADAFILTRCRRMDSGSVAEDELARRCPHTPVFRAQHAPGELVFPSDGSTQPPGFLAGRTVAAFAAIARPEEFRHTLTDLGADLVAFRAFRDHHRLTAHEWSSLIAEHQRCRAQILVTTEKDWVRLSAMGFQHPSLAYLRVYFHLLGGKEKLFAAITERRALRAQAEGRGQKAEGRR